MKLFKALAIVTALAASAAAGPYQGISLSTSTGQAVENISGQLKLAASSATFSTFTVVADGASGGVNASSFTAKYGVIAATASLSGSGAGIYSLTTSSGINVSAGGVSAPFFSGALFGTSNNLAGGAAGSLPYQSAANTTALLASSVNGYALQQTAGVPAWVASVSSSTNLAAGAAGNIPYQSAANTTAFLPAMAGTTGIVLGASPPSTGTLQGTTSQITVTRNTTGLILATPQNIDTAATPTFGGLTLTNGLGAANVTTSSTLTVVGNAFSVGGSSFTVVGGSATVAYQLQAGSISVPGPNGNAVFGASVTAGSYFGNGANLSGITGALSGLTNGYSLRATATNAASAGSFIDNGSSVTLPSGNKFLIAAGSTLTVAGASNLPVMVSSIDVVSVLNGSPQTNYTTMTITGLQSWEVNASSINWLFTWNCITSSSAAQFAMQFNGDGAANYRGGSCRGGSAGDVCDKGTSQNFIPLDANGSAATAGQIGGLHFSTLPGTPTTMLFNGNPMSVGSTDYAYYLHVNGAYIGAAVVSTINFTSSTGASSLAADRKEPLNCHFELWKNFPVE